MGHVLFDHVPGRVGGQAVDRVLPPRRRGRRACRGNRPARRRLTRGRLSSSCTSASSRHGAECSGWRPPTRQRGCCRPPGRSPPPRRHGPGGSRCDSVHRPASPPSEDPRPTPCRRAALLLDHALPPGRGAVKTPAALPVAAIRATASAITSHSASAPRSFWYPMITAQIRRTDQQRVDPVNGGDRLDVVERFAGFDLGDQADLRICRGAG
jgi:hypothetical protein